MNLHRQDGQLCPEERQTLYKLVTQHKPSVVCEVGTWRGGGSTYFLSLGLAQNGVGKLYSVELDTSFYQQATALYAGELSYLKPFVELHFGNSLEIYPTILSTAKRVDMVFLDGAEDPQQTVKELQMFQPHLSDGAIVAMHDWKTAKCRDVKPMLRDTSTWTPIVEFLHTTTGFVAFQYRRKEDV